MCFLLHSFYDRGFIIEVAVKEIERVENVSVKTLIDTSFKTKPIKKLGSLCVDTIFSHVGCTYDKNIAILDF